MKEFIKQIPATTIIIMFLFICGGLYLIGYWSTFDIDISNIVSLADIPKSFIMPFVFSAGLFVVNTFLNFLTYNPSIDLQPENKPKSIVYKKSWWRKLLRILFSLDSAIYVCLIIISYYYYDYKKTASFWMLCASSISILIVTKVERMEIIKKMIPSFYLRNYTISFLIFTPILSYGIGKSKSVNVYNNTDVRYINTKMINNITGNHDTISLKFLGFLGDKFIVSSLDNKRIFVLNQSSFPVIELDSVAIK